MPVPFRSSLPTKQCSKRKKSYYSSPPLTAEDVKVLCERKIRKHQRIMDELADFFWKRSKLDQLSTDTKEFLISKAPSNDQSKTSVKLPSRGDNKSKR